MVRRGTQEINGVDVDFCGIMCLQIPIVLAPIWLLYGYAAPIVDEYLAGSSEVGREEVNRARYAGPAN